MHHLIISLVADDRPGLVEALAERVSAHGGNWLGSRMTRLAGKFAGIVEIEISTDQRQALLQALEGDADASTQIVVTEGDEQASTSAATLNIEVEGQDRPGIIRDISALLASQGVNVLDMRTACNPAPMSGGEVFSASLAVELAAGGTREALQDGLEALAADLYVDISLAES